MIMTLRILYLNTDRLELDVAEHFLDFESISVMYYIRKEKPVIMIGNVLITYIGYFLQ